MMSQQSARTSPLHRRRRPPWDVIAASAWKRTPATTAYRLVTVNVRRRVTSLSQTQVKIHYGGAKCGVRLTSTLGRALYRYGFEDPEIELLYRLLEPGDTFVDAGAHVGLFALIAGSRVGEGGSVIAVEPATLTYQELVANVEMNGYDWVEPVHLALGSDTGVGSLTTFAGDQAALSSFSPGARPGGRVEEVRLDTIDNVLSQHHPGRVTAMKIDVEGAELDAVRGAAATLREWRPDVLIEVEPAHLARQGATVDELRAPFRELGYTAFRVGRGPALVADDTWTMPWRTPNVFLTVRPEEVERRLAGAGP